MLLTKKMIAIFSMLPLSAALISCGGGDGDGNNMRFTSGENGDKIEVVSFGYSSGKDGVDYIERANIKISSKHTMVTEKAVYGHDSEDHADEENITEYLLADKFKYSVKNNRYLAANTFVDSDLDYHLLWKDPQTGNTLREDATYVAVNIAGQSGSSQDSLTGFNTILNNLPAIKQDSFSFPAGSLCYIKQSKTDKDYVTFDSSDIRKIRDLVAWKAEWDSQAKFIDASVGSYNNLPVVYTQYARQDNGHIIYPAAVFYDGKVYNADYVPAYKEDINSNPQKGLVSCDTYNEIAANFIESEIRKVYK